jgi:hypothetical protein
VHKLIVSQMRPIGTKWDGDLWQASCLLAVQLRQDRHGLIDAFADALARGQEWQKLVQDGLRALDVELREKLQQDLGIPGLRMDEP